MSTESPGIINNRAQGGGFQDFLSFKRMITPIMIQIFFWLGVLAVVVMSFITMSQQPLVGFLMLIFGPLAVRVYAELLILFFRMNDTLTNIEKNTAR